MVLLILTAFNLSEKTNISKCSFQFGPLLGNDAATMPGKWIGDEK